MNSMRPLSVLTAISQSLRIPRRFNSTSAQLPPKEILPYEVKRTTLGKCLPVYSEFKNGGNRILTIIRRIEGDRQALMKDLIDFAQIPKERVSLQPTTGHVIIKGKYVKTVRTTLKKLGF